MSDDKPKKKTLGPPAGYKRDTTFWAPTPGPAPTGPQSLTPVAVTATDPTGMPAGDPKDWEAVPRPNQDVTQTTAPKVEDTGLFGTFLSVMDNIVPDDMGGLIRGDSDQWLPDVPYVSDLYRNTVGKVAGVPLSGGETAINVINWGSEQMNHLGAALLSWMPGGIQTLDWEQSQNVSFGQVAQANAGIAYQEGMSGDVAKGLLSTLGTGVLGLLTVAIDPNQPVATEKDFNILDEEFQKRAFEENAAGRWGSGLADAVWLVAADPTIVGGKVTNVLRLGTKAAEFAGITNRALRTPGQIAAFGEDMLAAGERAAARKGGFEVAESTDQIGAGELIKGNRATEAAADEQLNNIMLGNESTLANNPMIKSSPFQRDALRLLAQTTVEDPQTAAALTASLAGYTPAFKILRERAPQLYDDWSTTIMNVDELHAAPTALLSDSQIATADALLDASLAAGQMITRGGSRVGATAIRSANAYRAGASATEAAAQGKYSVRAAQEAQIGRVGQWVTERIEGASASRPITMVRWVGKGTPAGIVHLKGGDGQTAQQEIVAFAAKAGFSGSETQAYVSKFVQATTPEARLQVVQEIERAAVRKSIANVDGLTEKSAMAAYESYAASRGRHLDSIRRSKHGIAVDPQSRQIISTPMFYTELDESFPMIDLKTFNRVVKGNRTFLKTVNDVEDVADHLNTLWKVSVLLRLGYTQRNIGEGFLRSVATLGMVATNPRALASLPSNTGAFIKYKSAARAAKAQNKGILQASKNLTEARQMLADARKAAGVPEFQAAQKKAADAMRTIRSLERKEARTGLTAAERKRLGAARRTHANATARADTINTTRIMPAQAELQRLTASEADLMREIDLLQDDLLKANQKAYEAGKGRKLLGEKSNQVGVDANGNPVYYAGAFEGVMGKQARMLASADATNARTFDASAQAHMDELSRSSDWKVYDPSTMAPEEMATYWTERATRINQHFRGDPLAEQIMTNTPIDDIRAWLLSPEGTKYRKDLSVNGRDLTDADQVDLFLAQAMRQIDAEVPPGKLRELAVARDVTPGEVAAVEAAKPDLPLIMGRGVDSSEANVFFKALNATQGVTDKLMKYLGTVPENKLLRHPYYNTVYKARQAELYRVAAEQGMDMGSAVVKGRINSVAHASALKATKETMYTIERLSNAAVMLRYVSPFFPAWENSIRVWGRIVYQNPAVLGYGNLLWNIPNNMGWVVDKNGEKVDRSNPLKDEGHFIVWPEPVAKVLAAKFGPFTPGEALRTRQGALNVVFPGSEPWFAGVGPMTQIPTALVLRGKPELTDMLRNSMSEEMFKQFVPSGNPNVDLFEVLAPTAVRKLKQLWQGEDTDSAYLSTFNTMLEDAYIQSQIDGTVLTTKDIERVQESANQFWTWQVVAALGLPFQSQFESKFQVQRDKWNQLLDDSSKTYQQKVDAFQEMFPDFGDALLAITRGGSSSAYGLQPNLSTWKKITANPEFVDELAATSPELVGMFANMGSWDDPYSYSTYTEMQSNNFGGSSASLRRKKTPEELLRSNQVTDGWRAYHEVMDTIEDEVKARGYSSLQVNDAQWLRDIKDAQEAEIAKQYPAWGEERSIYTDKLPMFLTGARKIVANANLVDEDTTIAALAEYLNIRDQIAAAKAQSNDSDYKKSLDQIGYKAAWDLRNSDIGFADFYDQYLSGDDFRQVN